MEISVQHPWFRRGSSYPIRLFNQFFGEGVFDYPGTVSAYYRPSLFRNMLDSNSSGISEVRSEEDRFTIYLDVKHFSPEELSVNITTGYVEIQGKHQERQDDHGYISREFHRRYRLPSDVDQAAITCSLSGDGLLTLNAPRLTREGESCRGERSIPIRSSATNEDKKV
ncbi:Alpha-crystallin A chain [Merluccius polli]|uniref:Alpha-crystallin A chain n=1 Tax=Merluccius polli TaxID=89951 RepID=A0AA47P195_MERPO|nr:Alpha-crystallin A chain [Merluccius polli]